MADVRHYGAYIRTPTGKLSPRISKLARSSPSPPPARRLSQSGRGARPLRSSLSISRAGEPAAAVALDWSTSYQASASSSAAFAEEESFDEADDSDPDAVVVRGRPPEPAPAMPTPSARAGTGKPLSRHATIFQSQNGTRPAISHAKSLAAHDFATLTKRTRTHKPSRSRSPPPTTPPARSASPVALLRPGTGPPKSKQQPAPKPPQVAFLPTAFRLRLNMPFTRLAVDGVIDARTTGEALLLLGAVFIACSRLREFPDEEIWAPLGTSPLAFAPSIERPQSSRRSSRSQSSTSLHRTSYQCSPRRAIFIATARL